MPSKHVVLWIPKQLIKLGCCHWHFDLEEAARHETTKYLNAEVLQASSTGATTAEDILKNPALAMRCRLEVCQSE